MQHSISIGLQNPKNTLSSQNFLQKDPIYQMTQTQAKLNLESSFSLANQNSNYQVFSLDTIESYQLKPNLLDGSQLEQFHRAQIRLWIAESCHSRKIHFRTASLACYILDIYFSKDKSCNLQELHQYGICCLIIANKLEDNFPLTINTSVFKIERLLEIQAKICFRINFRFNPLTFTDIIGSLTNLWREFKKKIQKNWFYFDSKGQKLFSLQEKAKIMSLQYSFVLLHELLELIQLVLKSFRYKLDVLVFNAFYFVLCVQFHNYTQKISSYQLPRLTNDSKQMGVILQCFQIHCINSSYLLNIKVMEDCQSFIRPLYNYLISQKDKDLNQFSFDPNDPSLRIKDNNQPQTFIFKNKKESLKKYRKRENIQKFRKCSEVTHQ